MWYRNALWQLLWLTLKAYSLWLYCYKRLMVFLNSHLFIIDLEERLLEAVVELLAIS